jgi:DHA2 family multidrug resistance protein
VRGYSALQIGEAVFSTGVFQILSRAVVLVAGATRRPALDHDDRVGAVRTSRCGNYSPITHDWGAQQLLFPQALRAWHNNSRSRRS